MEPMLGFPRQWGILPNLKKNIPVFLGLTLFKWLVSQPLNTLEVPELISVTEELMSLKS